MVDVEKWISFPDSKRSTLLREQLRRYGTRINVFNILGEILKTTNKKVV